MDERDGTNDSTPDGEPAPTAGAEPTGEGAATPAAGRATTHRDRAAVRDWKDAVTPRSALLCVGVFLLMLAFALSYMGALHHPKPHHIDLAVAAPSRSAGPLLAQLNGLPGEPVEARAVSDAATARRQVTTRDADGALVVTPAASGGGTARLIVASAAGPSMSQALERVMTAVAPRAGLRLSVTDVKPLPADDFEELSSFYLVVAWSVGGYLVASMLGVSAGTRPANLRRAFIRLLAMAVYSIAAGVGGAIVVGPVLHALPATVGQLWWIGALLVFSAAAFTMAMQVLAGVIGIGIAIAVFVVLGNPSSGGVFPWPMLPAFWRAIGPWIGTGAATQTVRNVSYFDSHHITAHLLVICGYLVFGVLVALLVPGLKARRPRRVGSPAHLAAEA
ncbi:hypothetical protein [Actinocatenispora sera]|uniref:Membrane protein n=1 Tax=Actinocatenispora sera TaxID=390989 RepID=A0A810KVY4_9ACTN|nr:hypothetical protein [Actinocatenispora sera]BCJ26835.1 membrane protein [Actinocatenispora sera]